MGLDYAEKFIPSVLLNTKKLSQLSCAVVRKKFISCLVLSVELSSPYSVASKNYP